MVIEPSRDGGIRRAIDADQVMIGVVTLNTVEEQRRDMASHPLGVIDQMRTRLIEGSFNIGWKGEL